MARSIHETRRSWARLRRYDFSNPEEKEAAVGAAVRRLWKKRRIKNAIRRERRQDAPAQEPVSVSTIPIHVDDDGPLAHHGAAAEDIRAFLEFMPASVTEGIQEIRLCLGTAYMEETGASSSDRDPFFRRLGSELLPGLFVPPVLGLYTRKSGKIAIFAYVWDKQASLRLPAYVSEFYLRLQTLSVLAHEVAHHHDEARRVARGRWLSDRKETYENYAEKMQWEWMHDFVFPHIERRYGREWQQVEAWVREYGGGAPALELMAGDPRYTTRDGLIRLATSTSEATADLMKAVAEGKSLTESRLAYAWALHYADEYERCLQISTTLVADEPQNAAALTLHADTLEHLDRLDEALTQVDRALTLDANYEPAWRVRVRIMEDLKRWADMLEACDRWIVQLAESKKAILAHRAQAVALCALGRFAEMEDALAKGIPQRLHGDAKTTETVRRLIFKRAGRAENVSALQQGMAER